MSMTEYKSDPWQDDLRRGGPRQLTVHVFDGEGGGPEQHLGSITFPDWMTFCGNLDVQPGPYEMAAEVRNFLAAQKHRGVLGFGIALVGRDDASPRLGNVGGVLRRSDCDQCLAKAYCPQFWAAFAEVDEADGGRMIPVDVASWAARDTEEQKRAVWGQPGVGKRPACYWERHDAMKLRPEPQAHGEERSLSDDIDYGRRLMVVPRQDVEVPAVGIEPEFIVDACADAVKGVLAAAWSVGLDPWDVSHNGLARFRTDHECAVDAAWARERDTPERG